MPVDGTGAGSAQRAAGGGGEIDEHGNDNGPRGHAAQMESCEKRTITAKLESLRTPCKKGLNDMVGVAYCTMRGGDILPAIVTVTSTAPAPCGVTIKSDTV